MKNANAKGFDKNRKQSSSLQFKSQDNGKKDARCKVEFNQPFCWLYSVPNLLIF